MGRAPASALETDPQAASSPCVLYECGLDLNVTIISPNVFELIGIRPENILGKSTLWRDRLLSEDRKRLYSKLTRLARSEIASETHRINNDRGLPVWVAHSFWRIGGDRDGGVHGCIMPLAGADHSARLESSVINQFVHRIGNHFQLINLLIDSLQRKVSNLDELENLQQTVECAVEFTRSFSRYSQPPILNASVQIGEMLRSLILSWEPCFDQNHVAVETVFHPSLDMASVAADPFLLESAFGSVLQNALDATTSGDRLIFTGRAELLGPGEGSTARILITDTGSGMGEDEVANAAVPFMTTKRNRNGLGLSSAVRIIELHGGVVNISSRRGQGTEVEILLPVNDATEGLVR